MIFVGKEKIRQVWLYKYAKYLHQVLYSLWHFVFLGKVNY